MDNIGKSYCRVSATEEIRGQWQSVGEPKFLARAQILQKQEAQFRPAHAVG
jgi:hypothetical protein